MGKKDSSTKVLMKRREIFADAFGLLFQCAGITVDMDSLEERDTVVTLPVNIGDAAEWVDRANDVAFEAFVRHVGETDFVLLCVENQSEVAYDMPLRNLITSGLQWWKYRTLLGKKNSEEKNLAKGGEFLSKIRKDDRLPPVVIMVLYLGLKPWTGPKRFQDMVSPTIPGLRQFMSDSPTNVVSLVDLTAKEQTYLKSPLRILSKLLQTHGDKKAMRRVLHEDPMSHDIPAIIFRVFNDLTNSKLTIPRKKEHNDMCKALDDIKEEGRAEGREEGRAEGRAEERENNIHNLVNSCEQQGFSMKQILKVLMDTFGLSLETAMTYLPDPIN